MSYAIDPSDIAHLNQFSSVFCKMMEAEKPTSLLLEDLSDGAHLRIGDTSGTIQTTISGNVYQTLDPVLEYCLVLTRLLKEHSTTLDKILKSSLFDLTKNMAHVWTFETGLFNLLVSENYSIRNVWLDHFAGLQVTNSESDTVVDFSEQTKINESVLDAYCNDPVNQPPSDSEIVNLKANEWALGQELARIIGGVYVVEDIRVGIEFGEVTYVEFVANPDVPLYPSNHVVCQYAQMYLNIVKKATQIPGTLGIFGTNTAISLADVMLNDNHNLISGELANLLRVCRNTATKNFSPHYFRNTLGSGVVNAGNWPSAPIDVYDPNRCINSKPQLFSTELIWRDLVNDYNAAIDGTVSGKIHASPSALLAVLKEKPERFAFIRNRMEGIVIPWAQVTQPTSMLNGDVLRQLLEMYRIYTQYKKHI